MISTRSHKEFIILILLVINRLAQKEEGISQISSTSILVLIRFKHNLKAQRNKFKMAIHKDGEKKKMKIANHSYIR